MELHVGDIIKTENEHYATQIKILEIVLIAAKLYPYTRIKIETILTSKLLESPIREASEAYVGLEYLHNAFNCFTWVKT